jgi:hypothetical protein
MYFTPLGHRITPRFEDEGFLRVKFRLLSISVEIQIQ